ncbi:baseplate J/gp47 family protein [Lachnoclostridium sp. An14]|uniref:baseplate J/gp47 family protein n=1 Tax=Lachnoclostridium sp. An14 TaxID=1965562 RepID=UPI0013A5FD69|nr:baseplate J/gp47 family protein [Lachnoclostridium sp. An14]
MIDLSGYTQKAIEKQMLEKVPSGIDTREGSIIQTAVGPAAWFLEGTYITLDQLQQNAYADTAVGVSLDYRVAERGLTRKSATPAVRRGIFDVEIPESSQFKTINGANSVIFVSGEQVEADPSNDEETGKKVYLMTCQTAGVVGNSYTGNLIPITAIAGLTSAVIGKIVTPGTDEETDDSLKARYFASFDVANFGGNIASYRNTILAMDGVGAVQVYPAWQGGGTVLCSILSDQLTPAEDGVIQAVQDAICPSEEGGSDPSANGYGMAPIGAKVTITTATNITLNIACNIQFSAKVVSGEETFQAEVEEKIREYLTSVCQTWGSAIKGQKIEYVVVVYISRIVAAILTIPDIVNVSNVTINGSAADLILTETASLQQIPSLGTVTINGG